MNLRTPCLLAVAMLLLALPACSTTGESSAPSGDLEVGEVAPDFTLPSAEGESVSLEHYRGHQPALLYFSMGPG